MQPLVSAVVVVLALCGCDVETYDDAASAFNSGSPPPPPPPPPASPPPPSPPPPSGFGPTFSEIQANVFTPDCATSGCHSGGAPAANLNLEAANSYAMLVGIASMEDPNVLLVDPGNPDQSLLVQTLEGPVGNTRQMPPGAALPQSEIDVIRQWILDGAVDDRVQTPAAPVRVTTITPAPGAALSAQPPQIIAGFDRDVDASTVNDLTFELTASGGDGSFADGNEMQIAVGAAAISVPVSNPAGAVMDLGGVTLADDSYQVRLRGDGGSVIMDLDANALDGEYLGVLPSGDGTAGGDFEVTFTLTTPVMLGPTLDQIQAVVFDTRCASCHSPTGSASATGLFLDNADSSHMTLVNVESVTEAGKTRVIPGDPDTSYLVEKIENRQMAGQRMPPSGNISADEIAAIRQWIADGALRQ